MVIARNYAVLGTVTEASVMLKAKTTLGVTPKLMYLFINVNAHSHLRLMCILSGLPQTRSRFGHVPSKTNMYKSWRLFSSERFWNVDEWRSSDEFGYLLYRGQGLPETAPIFNTLGDM